MKLTVLFKSQTAKLEFSLTRNKLLALLVLVSGLFLISSRSTHLPEENISRIQYTQTGLNAEAAKVSALKDQTEQKITGLVLKMAQMQSQIQRLDALGARLVEQADLDPAEFSFGQRPSMGGPIDDSELEIKVEHELIDKMDQMLAQIETKSVELSALESIMLNHHVITETQLQGKPIQSGWLSSYYGMRADPFNGRPAMHKGLDFAGKEGEPVVATGAGVITWSGSRYGYGELVEIDHGNGLRTRYGHNKALSVKVGDVVTKGQQIAVMGNTGRSTGAHVHYEVLRRGKQLDPLPFVY